VTASAPAVCPHCAVAMQSVTARAYSGYCVALDQCLRCGGIWCDRWELFPVTAEEAERLDTIDEKKVGADVPAPQTPGRCPRCGIDLKTFHDPLLPPDARIERCRVCEGMWLNRGELIRFKRRAPHRPRLTGESLDALAEAYGTTAKWSTVRELDGAVRPGEEPLAADETTRSALWATVPFIVLRLLLRLVLGV